jgi:hypothetical protein
MGKVTEVEDRYDEYDDFLDECNETVKIGSLKYSPSYTLKNVDPIAYNCGYSDYTDAYPQWQCEECANYFNTEEEAIDCCDDE